MERRAQKASTPSAAPVEASPTLGGSIDPPRLDGQRGADAGPSSEDVVVQRQPDVTFPEKEAKTLRPEPIRLVRNCFVLFIRVDLDHTSFPPKIRDL